MQKSRNFVTYEVSEFLKVASARAALGATSPVVEPHLRGQRGKNLNFYTRTHQITKYLHYNVFIAPNWTQLKFLTLLCRVFGFWYQIMSRITVFSCQILCRESRCFWSHILTLQKAAGATIFFLATLVTLKEQWDICVIK